ncbi:DUF4625 domain-containing protein [Maribellus sp. CM-23]|uniref:DUF4625 domain-containing protein n=1 Tax=Maribellus sp. CM-23 TaxID=2781026 RepID=UPI001F2A9A2D|nr:DUF4625 domain-containing protein [Maribellus sp. CM-23]MCE4565341.1 DUF4625 domain-containing protein [Maribellus sp. CM-23]
MKTNLRLLLPQAKTIIYLLSIPSVFYLTSCDDDGDTQKPLVTNLEVGHGDTIHIGEGIHLEFDAEDDGLLDYYRIQIHPENGHDKSALGELAWDYDSTFTEISGLHNHTVHHHNIMVPVETAEGAYHFHLMVADKAGNVTAIERELVATHEDGEHTDED